jgi:hypothetical protein
MKKLVPSLDWGKFDIEHRQKRAPAWLRDCDV